MFKHIQMLQSPHLNLPTYTSIAGACSNSVALYCCTGIGDAEQRCCTWQYNASRKQRRLGFVLAQTLALIWCCAGVVCNIVGQSLANSDKHNWCKKYYAFFLYIIDSLKHLWWFSLKRNRKFFTAVNFINLMIWECRE